MCGVYADELQKSVQGDRASSEASQQNRFQLPKWLLRTAAAFILSGQVSLRILSGRIHWKNTMEQLRLVGPRSLGVALLTAGFVGMVFTIQVSLGFLSWQMLKVIRMMSYFFVRFHDIWRTVCPGVCQAGSDKIGWWGFSPSIGAGTHSSCHKHHLGR